MYRKRQQSGSLVQQSWNNFLVFSGGKFVHRSINYFRLNLNVQFKDFTDFYLYNIMKLRISIKSGGKWKLGLFTVQVHTYDNCARAIEYQKC